MKKNIENLNQYKSAYESDFKFTDENHAMLQWYAFKLLEKASVLKKLDILSFGIGHGIVSRTLIDNLGSKIDRYVIIEGAQDIIDRYVVEYKTAKGVELVHSYFEDYETEQLFHIIEMGFILEHVAKPQHIIERYCQMLKPNGRIFIAVPNAKSLHRLIGHKAGLLKNLYELSKYDLQLGHKSYFDLDSIKDLVERSGLKIVSIEGIFLKPITTNQIKKLHFSREIMQALYQIGVAYPEISNAILIEAKNR